LRGYGLWIVDCTVDFHAGGTGASGCFWSEKSISNGNVGKPVREQGPFNKLRVILVGN
jgi:hypothetical protein